MLKYPHIQNHYKESFLGDFVDEFPELKNVKYVVQEKIHGMNIRIRHLNGEITYGTRNIVKRLEDIRYLADVIPDEIIEILKGFDNIIIFGELWGPKVQKEIKYSDKPFIRFFDIMIDDELIPQKQFYDMIPQQYIVPTYKIVDGLENALDIDVANLKSLINPECLAEGVVIKPYDKVYRHYRDVFYVKKKRFGERRKHSYKSSKFKQYVTKGRVSTVVAREGGIEEKRQIGKFVNLVMQDIADETGMEITKLDKKICGKIITKYLFELLNS